MRAPWYEADTVYTAAARFRTRTTTGAALEQTLVATHHGSDPLINARNDPFVPPPALPSASELSAATSSKRPTVVGMDSQRRMAGPPAMVASASAGAFRAIRRRP